MAKPMIRIRDPVCNNFIQIPSLYRYIIKSLSHIFFHIYIYSLEKFMKSLNHFLSLVFRERD